MPKHPNGGVAGDDRGRSVVPAVTRAVAILDLIATSRTPLGISAIARALDLPKSSVANICGSLTDAGLLRPNGAGFSLGHRLAQLGAAYLAGADQVQLFHQACARLDAARSETVQLALLAEGLDVIYLARREGAFPVRLASTFGHALPATCTATGKAMLADLDDDDIRNRLASLDALPRLTPMSIATPDALWAELAEIRRTGHAFDREEVIEGVVCVAAAVPGAGPSGEHLAVSITLLKPRATPELLAAYAAELQVMAGQLARDLGHVARSGAISSPGQRSATSGRP